MTPTMPELGWSGTVGVTVFIMLMVAGVVLYHLWMDRRLTRDRERSAARPKEEYRRAGEIDEFGRHGEARQRLPKTEP